MSSPASPARAGASGSAARSSRSRRSIASKARQHRTETPRPVAAPPIVSVSQWACCQVRAHIMPSTSIAPAAHHRRLVAAGTATTARITTTQAMRDECPEGKAGEETATMTSSGRGRSPRCLRAWVTAYVARKAATANRAERQRRMEVRTRANSSAAIAAGRPPPWWKASATAHRGPSRGPPWRRDQASSSPWNGGETGSTRNHRVTHTTVNRARVAAGRARRDFGNPRGVIAAP